MKERNNNLVLSKVEALPVNKESDDRMISEWLSKNKPSKRFEDEKKLGHVTPEPTLGAGVTRYGSKI